MKTSTPFSIFGRPPAPAEPDMAPLQDDQPAAGNQPEPLLLLDEAAPQTRPEAGNTASGWHLELAGIAMAASQLGLANPSVITLHVTLPEQPPTPVASAQTGVYQPAAVGAGDIAPRTGLVTGTHILTDHGEITVEALQEGERVLGLRGPALRPVRWIGRSALAASCVRIEAGALGRGVPHRPLCLAPDQPVFLQPGPVAARSLVNGGTIRAVDLEDVELFLIDLGSQDVLFAEGLPLSSARRVSP